MSNNQAKYEALKEMGADDLIVKSDLQLVTRQVS